MTVELYVVSDFTGETAEHVARAAASQFGPEAAKLVRFRYVNNEEKGMEILRTAKELNAVLICTLVDHSLRKWFVRKATEEGLDLVDILGPILDILGRRLDRPPLETPGLLRRRRARGSNPRASRSSPSPRSGCARALRSGSGSWCAATRRR